MAVSRWLLGLTPSPILVFVSCCTCTKRARWCLVFPCMLGLDMSCFFFCFRSNCARVVFQIKSTRQGHTCLNRSCFVPFSEPKWCWFGFPKQFHKAGGQRRVLWPMKLARVLIIFLYLQTSGQDPYAPKYRRFCFSPSQFCMLHGFVQQVFCYTSHGMGQTPKTMNVLFVCRFTWLCQECSRCGVLETQPMWCFRVDYKHAGVLEFLLSMT